MKKKRNRIVRALSRALQFVTNVHRIHHIRWSYGYTFRPLPWAYFPAFKTRQGEVIRYGWRRVDPLQFHDCTLRGG